MCVFVCEGEGHPNKKGGGAPTKDPKINKRGGGGGGEAIISNWRVSIPKDSLAELLSKPLDKT